MENLRRLDYIVSLKPYLWQGFERRNNLQWYRLRLAACFEEELVRPSKVTSLETQLLSVRQR